MHKHLMKTQKMQKVQFSHCCVFFWTILQTVDTRAFLVVCIIMQKLTKQNSSFVLVGVFMHYINIARKDNCVDVVD